MKHKWITFFLETYIELLISAVVAFKMYEFRAVWNNWDKYAAICHVIGIVATIAFFIFICWFVFVKDKLFQRKLKLASRLRHKRVIKRALSDVTEA